VTPRMHHDGLVFKCRLWAHPWGVCLSVPACVSLPFGYQSVGKTGGSEHGPKTTYNRTF